MKFHLFTFVLSLILPAIAQFVPFATWNQRRVCAGIPATDFQSGSGTPAAPYIICWPDQLLRIETDPDYLISAFKLGQDLDMSTANLPVQPIGFHDRTDIALMVPFRGTFDGDNFKITNFNYVTTNTDYGAGLFAATNGATIRNLRLEEINIQAHRDSGTLIGYALNTNIENVYVEGSLQPSNLSTQGIRVGGLIGQYRSDGTSGANSISRVTVNVPTIASDQASAFIGFLRISDGSSMTIEKTTISGSLAASDVGNTLGGSFGWFESVGSSTVTVRKILATNHVSQPYGGGSWSGGFIGQLRSGGSTTSETIVFEDIHRFGNITTTASASARRGSVGNFIGQTRAETNNSYSFRRIGVVGNILLLEMASGTHSGIGGLISDIMVDGRENSTWTFEDSFFTGDISSLNPGGTSRVGGMTGDIPSSSTATNIVYSMDRCYSNFTTSIPSLTSAHTVIHGGYTDLTLSKSNVFHTGASGFNDGSYLSVSGHTKLTASEVLQQASFTGYDFTNVWSIQEGVESPRLRPFSMD
jgi:hypothetical protein